MSGFLERILASRREHVSASKAAVPPAEVEREAQRCEPPRDFRGALTADGVSLIAEFKRASPSRGVLRAGLDPVGRSVAYERGGARAISVLTEPEFFDGSDADLVAARAATSVPALWKDFVIDPYQVTRARSMTADAVLIIVRICTDDLLRSLLAEARRWGMCGLVEVFDEHDLRRALTAGAEVIGVNHRDLSTFAEDRSATARLRPSIPEGVIVVAESAISTRADVVELERIGVDAMLVGEALVRADDPAAKIRELLGR